MAGGVVSAVPARRIGEIVARLGAGRARKGDDVDPAVGVSLEVELGDHVEAGQRVAVVHARSADDAQRAVNAVQDAIVVNEEAAHRDVIISWILPG